jgi:hypothetical protein
MKFVTHLSDWISSLFNKKSKSIPEDSNKPVYRSRPPIQDISVEKYVEKIEILRNHFDGFALWKSVVRLYYNQKLDVKSLVKGYKKMDKKEFENRLGETTIPKFEPVDLRTPDQIEQLRFQDDFIDWLSADKQKKISEATPEIFIEYVKTYHKLTDQMLDHVRVTAVWVNGVFVNYKAWNKEIDDVKTFFQQKDLTSDDTVTI